MNRQTGSTNTRAGALRAEPNFEFMVTVEMGSKMTYFVENFIEQPCAPFSFPLKPTPNVSAAFLSLLMHVPQNIDLAWGLVSPYASACSTTDSMHPQRSSLTIRNPSPVSIS